jgi:hypothetical protein
LLFEQRYQWPDIRRQLIRDIGVHCLAGGD